MNKFLVLVLMLVTAQANATRARVNSLGNSPHIIDVQRIYTNPSDMFSQGDFFSLESGSTAYSTTSDCDAATPGNQPCKNLNTEAMVVKTFGDAKFGFSIGHQSDNAAGYVGGLRTSVQTTFAPQADISFQQNPIELSYGVKVGDAAYAGTVVYSNYKDKKNDREENSSGVRLGGRIGALDFSIGQGIASKVTSGTTIEYKAKANTGLFAGYTVDNNYFFGDFRMVGSEETKSTEKPEFKANVIKAGVVNSMKNDGSEYFVGASILSVKQELAITGGDFENTLTQMPLIIGVEADAASWLTLRGSITQTVLLNKTKVQFALSSPSNPALQNTNNLKEFDDGANNTLVSMGAGLKFDKLTLDGNFSGLTGATAGQRLDGNNLLTQIGLTYMF